MRLGYNEIGGPRSTERRRGGIHDSWRGRRRSYMSGEHHSAPRDVRRHYTAGFMLAKYSQLTSIRQPVADGMQRMGLTWPCLFFDLSGLWARCRVDLPRPHCQWAPRSFSFFFLERKIKVGELQLKKRPKENDLREPRKSESPREKKELKKGESSLQSRQYSESWKIGRDFPDTSHY